MAIIYGTPAILWPKPDTSEYWLLNSSVRSGGVWSFEEIIDFISNNEEFFKFAFITD